MFWIIAAIALLLAALVTFMPMLSGQSGWKPAALALVFLLPAAGLWLYNEVGTPAGIGLEPAAPHAAAAAADEEEIEDLIASLRGRLDETPASLDGWILMARTLKTMQRFPEAAEALETALRIDPENPLVMVELAETRIFLSNDGRIDETSVLMLERALEKQPDQQKALWLLGVASAQAGDLAFAISYWESLLALVEPGSSVAQSVQGQINEARARLGMEVESPAVASEPSATTEPATAPMASAATGMAQAAPAAEVSAPPMAGDWPGIPVRVTASAAAQAAIPKGAVLFVIVRSAGPAAGPPLGVRRIIDPALPLEITLSDRDSMIAERKISLETEVQLQARVSLRGSPAASSGDWQSAPATVALDSAEGVELTLDQQVE